MALNMKCPRGHTNTLVFDHIRKRFYTRCIRCEGWWR
jgi:hypothetical protein